MASLFNSGLKGRSLWRQAHQQRALAPECAAHTCLSTKSTFSKRRSLHPDKALPYHDRVLPRLGSYLSIKPEEAGRYQDQRRTLCRIRSTQRSRAVKGALLNKIDLLSSQTIRPLRYQFIPDASPQGTDFITAHRRGLHRLKSTY